MKSIPYFALILVSIALGANLSSTKQTFGLDNEEFDFWSALETELKKGDSHQDVFSLSIENPNSSSSPVPLASHSSSFGLSNQSDVAGPSTSTENHTFRPSKRSRKTTPQSQTDTPFDGATMVPTLSMCHSLEASRKWADSFEALSKLHSPDLDTIEQLLELALSNPFVDPLLSLKPQILRYHLELSQLLLSRYRSLIDSNKLMHAYQIACIYADDTEFWKHGVIHLLIRLTWINQDKLVQDLLEQRPRLKNAFLYSLLVGAEKVNHDQQVGPLVILAKWLGFYNPALIIFVDYFNHLRMQEHLTMEQQAVVHALVDFLARSNRHDAHNMTLLLINCASLGFNLLQVGAAFWNSDHYSYAFSHRPLIFEAIYKLPSKLVSLDVMISSFISAIAPDQSMHWYQSVVEFAYLMNDQRLVSVFNKLY